ncbi:hypothetical protein [Haloglomus halophilum]|uniref:hypothetical protein n=1 Tax=Haloglomus halophilum TaxID=2962672 RepID=UPI0020C9CAB0|nr:hypothetical protein [Haloglomus halophilum]
MTDESADDRFPADGWHSKTEPRVESDGGVARPNADLGRGTELPPADAGNAAAESTDESLLSPHGRSLLAYVGSVVAVFVAAGVGLGLGSNFILGFLIEQFVEPGASPTDSTLVSIMLLHNVITPFLVGPLMAIGAGALLGRALPDRPLTATAVGGTASLVGFYLMTGLTLFLTINVIAQYSTGGGGGGGALDQAALGKQVIESGIPAALVGAAGAYIGSYISD